MARAQAKKKIEFLSDEENKNTSVIVGDAVKYLRKVKKVSQTELGNLLSLHQTAVCRVEQGDQDLTPGQLNKVAHFFSVKADSILSGDIRQSVFLESLQLPKKYQDLAFSKVRGLLPYFYFLEEEKGEKALQELLSKLGVKGLSYLDPQTRLSVNLELDFIRSVLEDGVVTRKNLSKLASQARDKKVQGFLHEVYRSQTSSLRLIQSLILNAHQYEENFDHQIEDVQVNSIVISVKPREHMKDVAYRDDILGDYICAYKKTYLSQFSRYIGEKPLNLIEQECHYHGSSQCIYKIMEN